MPNYHKTLALISKLEDMKHTLPKALEKMANGLIDDFDKHKHLSDFGIDTVNDLLEREK